MSVRVGCRSGDVVTVWLDRTTFAFGAQRYGNEQTRLLSSHITGPMSRAVSAARRTMAVHARRLGATLRPYDTRHPGPRTPPIARRTAFGSSCRSIPPQSTLELPVRVFSLYETGTRPLYFGISISGALGDVVSRCRNNITSQSRAQPSTVKLSCACMEHGRHKRRRVG